LEIFIQDRGLSKSEISKSREKTPQILEATVDGRNPKQPPGMYKTMKIMGYLPYQLVSRISEPSTVLNST